MKRCWATLFVFAVCYLLAGCLGHSVDARGEVPIYVLFTVDTEEDLPPFYNTYRGIEEGMPILLNIFEEYGVKATFFATGNVAIKYPDVISTISASHEVGCHGLEHKKKMKDLSYAEKYESISESTSILASIVGKDILSFRAPFHSLDNDTYQILEGMGYLVEASAYGGSDAPYHPSYQDWRQVGDMDILHIPVTHAESIFYPKNAYPDNWVDLFQQSIDSQDGKAFKLVVIGLHPWEMIEQEFYPILIDHEKPCGEYTVNELTSLLDHLSGTDVSYITMKDAWELISVVS